MITHKQPTPFSFSIGEIGDAGATSLTEALKSNKTLTQLDLESGYKRNNT